MPRKTHRPKCNLNLGKKALWKKRHGKRHWKKPGGIPVFFLRGRLLLF
jgi:hypothetical protein